MWSCGMMTVDRCASNPEAPTGVAGLLEDYPVGSASPVLPPSAPGSPRELNNPEDCELAGNVAHGFLNTQAVLSSATGVLRSNGVALPPGIADSPLAAPIGLVLDRQLSGVIAHGLVASLDLLSETLRTLRTTDRPLGTDIDVCRAAFSAQALVFQSGLQVILTHSSAAFANAATAFALAGRAMHHIDQDDSTAVFEGLIRFAAVLKTGLSALVLGLSPSAVAGRSLRPPPRSALTVSNFLEHGVRRRSRRRIGSSPGGS